MRGRHGRKNPTSRFIDQLNQQIPNPPDPAPPAAAPASRSPKRRWRKFFLTVFLICILGAVILIAAILSAGHWLPGIAPMVAAHWGVELEIGDVDLYPLKRAEIRGVAIFEKTGDAGRNAAPVATVEHVAITYESLGELTHKHIDSLDIRGVMIDEAGLMRLAQKFAQPAPTSDETIDWPAMTAMLHDLVPDQINLSGIAWRRPDGARYTLAAARFDKIVADDGTVRLIGTFTTAPIADMIPLDIRHPLTVSAEVVVSPAGLMVEDFAVDAGPVLRASGRTIDAISAPDALAIRLASLDWDWELAHAALGLEPVGDLRFKPIDLTVRASLAGGGPEWAGDFPPGAPTAEIRFPTSPIAWSDITTGRSVEGALAANVQAVLDLQTGRLHAALVTRAQVINLVVPGRRLHDATATIIGTADYSMARSEASWDLTIQAGAPLDAAPILEKWSGDVAGRTSGCVALAPSPGVAVAFDLIAALLHPSGEEISLPLKGRADWAMADGGTSSTLSASVGTLLDGADLRVTVSGDIATTPVLSARASWSNLNLAKTVRRAEMLAALPDFAVDGVTTGVVAILLPASGLIETSATLSLAGAIAEWPRGAPLLARPVSLHVGMDGRGLPWESDRGAQYNLRMHDEENFEVALSGVRPLSDDFMAWRFDSTARLADVAWLAALTSSSLPLEISGAIEQSGAVTAAMDGEALSFQYDGNVSLREFSVAPPGPEPIFKVEYFTTSLDVSTSGAVSAESVDVGFRVAPAEVEINQLTVPHLDWAFFEAGVSAEGRAIATKLFGDAAATQSLTLDLPRFAFNLPGMAETGGSFFGGAQVGDAGLAHPWGEMKFDAAITDATSLGWQLGVWQGDGDIRVRLYQGRVIVGGDRAEFDGRIEIESPHGEAPYAYVLWEDLKAAGAFKARTNFALTDYHLQSSGRAELGEAAGGGALVKMISARWKIDLPGARVTLDSAHLYGGHAWATATLDDFPAEPLVRAHGEFRDFDLEDFTTNYKTGDITMQGRMNVDWSAAWDFVTPTEYRARLRSASDVVTVDKDSVKWLLDQAFGGTANPLGFLSPARTLDRHYKKESKGAILHQGRVMVPFTQFEAMSRYQSGIFRNQIILENKYFSINFQPNVQAPVVLEFLEIAQSNVGP